MTDNANQIRELAQEEQFDKALDRIEEIEKSGPLPPNLLVLKAICIQLSENADRHPLSDAEAAFRAALSIDDEYVEALNELGHFLLEVDDDPAAAMSMFEKSLDICESQMTEAAIGMAMCLQRVAGNDKALQFLRDVSTSTIDMERIEELEREIKSS